jgi:hypothetical protein
MRRELFLFATAIAGVNAAFHRATDLEENAGWGIVGAGPCPFTPQGSGDNPITLSIERRGETPETPLDLQEHYNECVRICGSAGPWCLGFHMDRTFGKACILYTHSQALYNEARGTFIHLVNDVGTTTRTIPIYIGDEIFEASATVIGAVFPGFFLQGGTITEPAEPPTLIRNDYCVKRTRTATFIENENIPNLPTELTYEGEVYAVQANSNYELVKYGFCQTSIGGQVMDFIRWEFQVENSVLTQTEFVNQCYNYISQIDAAGISTTGVFAFGTYRDESGVRNSRCWFYFTSDTIRDNHQYIWDLIDNDSSNGGPVQTVAHAVYYDADNWRNVNGGALVRDFIPNEISNRRWPDQHMHGCFLLTGSESMFEQPTSTFYPTQSPTTSTPTLQQTPRPTLDYRPLQPGGYIGISLFGAAWVAFVFYIVMIYCS